ncbi:hypothetical protein [Synechocystis sp. PCC 7339]|nr:hypothetical protein [Synechocystis sp. PCC 7339]
MSAFSTATFLVWSYLAIEDRMVLGDGNGDHQVLLKWKSPKE